MKKTTPKTRAPRVSVEDKIAQAVAAALAGVKAQAPADPPVAPMNPQTGAAQAPAKAEVDKVRVTGLWTGKTGNKSGVIQKAADIIAFLQKYPSARAVILPNSYKKGPRDAEFILYFYPAEDRGGSQPQYKPIGQEQPGSSQYDQTRF